MHAEPKAFDAMTEAVNAVTEEGAEAAPGVVHNIMDVLYPKMPPAPKNARIIRLFDVEAAKSDPRPAASNDSDKAQQDRKNREEVRAQRNRSLLAAARLG